MLTENVAVDAAAYNIIINKYTLSVITLNTVQASTSPLFSFVEHLTLISLLMPSSRSVIIILGITSISVPTGVASLIFTIYGLLWKTGGLSLTSLIGITLLRDIVFGSVFATPSSEILLKILYSVNLLLCLNSNCSIIVYLVQLIDNQQHEKVHVCFLRYSVE